MDCRRFKQEAGGEVRSKKMLGRALGVECAVVESVQEAENGQGFVARVRPRAEHRSRCPVCLERCPGYDEGTGVRRWRTHGIGLGRTYVEAEAPRVECAEHGVLVAHFPWARRGSGFTRSFEDMVAWLVIRTDKTTLCELLGIAWRTVGSIIERVGEEARARRPPLSNLRRIGIDEVSYRKGHRYLTVVVDHDTGKLLWAEPGRDRRTVRKFFRMLGKRRCRRLQLVSADAAAWIGSVVGEMCPNAKLCIDPFHVVAWATKALDQVRRGLWNKLRRRGELDRAASMKGSRWALLKNPDRLNRRQRSTLAQLEKDNAPLYKAYLLKEQLREVFQTKDWQGPFMLQHWTDIAVRSRLKPFVRVAQTIRDNLAGIQHALLHGLSNARLEGVNTKLKLLTRLAYGFHSHRPLIALAMIKLGGLCPPLPRLV